VSFSGSATGGTFPYLYSWNFRDGETSSAENATHTYAKEGNNTATITVTDNKGLHKTAPVGIKINAPNDPLRAFISSFVISRRAPVTVLLRGGAIGGKPSYRYKWDFGDGKSSSLQNPTHSYSKEGRYILTLTVTDHRGVSAKTSTCIRVSGTVRPTF
jgi:PKD repeat protein